MKLLCCYGVRVAGFSLRFRPRCFLLGARDLSYWGNGNRPAKRMDKKWHLRLYSGWLKDFNVRACFVSMTAYFRVQVFGSKV